MSTWITICDTCRSGEKDFDHEGPRDGEQLAALIEGCAREGVRTRRTSCLMGCTHGCNVAIQGTGKLAYTLGRFLPTPEDAEAIADYAALHAASSSGQVPFRDWPQGVKGHFVTRHPPLPEVASADRDSAAPQEVSDAESGAGDGVTERSGAPDGATDAGPSTSQRRK